MAPETTGNAAVSMGRVLVVDDEDAVLRAHARVLTKAGYDVVTATDGLLATGVVGADNFDVVVTDISMPGLDGLGLLRSIRQRDLDVPVVLVTGEPTMQTAIRAVESGAHRYLVKPVPPRSLLDVVGHASRVHQIARLKRRALARSPAAPAVSDADLARDFDAALEGLWMAFQPIVAWPSREVHGYEALLRSPHPRLGNPVAVLAAAERLHRVYELGRRTRALVAEAMRALPMDLSCFVNLHPHDLLDEDLFAPDAPLTRLASRVVLELTERAALDDVADMHVRIGELRRLGFRIAIDDLGQGYAGLTTVAEIRPEVVKLDMSLVRNIHADELKQKLVGSMVALCRDMNVAVVAEGVETAEERDTLARLGAPLLQGYLFAKPGRPFPAPTW